MKEPQLARNILSCSKALFFVVLLLHLISFPGLARGALYQLGDVAKAADQSTQVDGMYRSSLSPSGFEVRGFKVAPIPATTKVTFQAIGSGIDRVLVIVYDRAGKLVLIGGRDGTSFEWRTTQMSNGLYFCIMVAFGEGQIRMSQVMKFVILR